VLDAQESGQYFNNIGLEGHNVVLISAQELVVLVSDIALRADYLGQRSLFQCYAVALRDFCSAIWNPFTHLFTSTCS